MAWIESHQALGHHPKTVKLADALGVNMLTAVGLIHYLWWWALDYAPDGIVKAADQAAAARACMWSKKPQMFWGALLSAGFVDAVGENDGEDFRLHDWMDYAGRLIQQRAVNAARTKRARDAQRGHTERAPYATTVPDQPDRTVPPKPPLADTPLGDGANGADGAAPRAFADAEPAALRPGAAQCPLCRLPFTGTYVDHTAAKHKVNASAAPGNLFTGRHTPPEAPSPEMEAQFAAMHAHLQSLPDEAQA